MPDWWEFRFGLDPDSRGVDKDTDGDGVSDLEEYLGDDGIPGNDDWSDPTDAGSKPDRTSGGPFPVVLVLFISALVLAAIVSFALYSLVRLRKMT
jgi:hypothetical protein